jgi:RNA polymerase sigma factor (sigma-70 family)
MPNASDCLPFEDVYSKYAEATLRKIYRYTRDKAVASDLLQDIFLKMWRNWSAFDKNKGTLYTWIMIITTTTCIDYLRRNSTNQPLPQQIRDIGEASRPIQPEAFVARRELLRLAGRLSPAQCEVLMLIYFKGLTQDEVAQHLNTPLGTIKSRQRSAILALRKMYAM